MSALVNIALCCSVLYLLYKLFTRTYDHWSSRGVAGPRPIAFFGNFLDVALGKEFRSTVTARIYRQHPTERFVGFYRLATPVLMVRDLDVVKQILVKDFDRFQDRGIEFSKEGVGANLFHSDGDTWNVLRKKLSPLFTPAKLKGMYYLVEDRAAHFVRYLERVIVDGEEAEVGGLTAKFTAEVIGACAFGVDIDAFNDRYNRHLDIGNKHMTPTLMVTLEMLLPGILKALNVDMFSKEVRDHYAELVRTIVREREGKPNLRNDFMDLMIEMKGKGTIRGSKVRSEDGVDLEITENIMTAQAFIFFGAGYETSSGTMSFMLYELAHNPDVQEKLVNEITSVLMDYGGEVTYEAITKMSYLEMVLMETLRKYPVIDIVRKAVYDYQLPGSSLTIPKGTQVLIPLQGIHYDPKYYKDPERFDPERFSPENIQERHPCAWLPFGAGPRECIGLRFARLQAKTGLVHFLRRFSVEPSAKTSSKLRFEPRRFTLLVRGGMWLSVRRRQ